MKTTTTTIIADEKSDWYLTRQTRRRKCSNCDVMVHAGQIVHRHGPTKQIAHNAYCCER